MYDNLTIDQLATRWDVSKATLARWRMEKKGPEYFKIGRKVLYPVSAVVDYEAKQPRKAGQPV